MNDLDALISYDPYDVWATPLFGRLKMDYNNGRLASRPLLACCYLADYAFPQIVRSILKCPQTLSPHVLAMHALMENDRMSTAERSAVLDRFASMNVLDSGFGWGLPFRWYSKHAVYSDRIPYITHTPYVMEALLELAADDHIAERAMDMFRGTWELVSALRVMAEGNGATALSYSPVEEGRIVNNAQSYAAFACALHAVHGDPNLRGEAVDLCLRLVNWILREQRPDGSWLYYADEAPGNFMDCFHTCFIIKNVSKVMSLVPEISETAAGSMRKAIDFLDARFLDRKRNLCRRFVHRVRHDPYRWDIYDQAEYLGVLIDQGRLDEAAGFRENSRRIFSNGNDWWCRIDWFGRRWGWNFLRWGIMPFKYHSARLDRVIRSGE
ncbi:hypothetical protein [Maridesulfovibrio sp.]|uniref:hypothetical protein n=1 Tax=Maridesulfovibrio sp. TaxID=2795000 RepID=UPI002A18C087|nr:hypothetical protein [Maridesulfovibrio sp.]